MNDEEFQDAPAGDDATIKGPDPSSRESADSERTMGIPGVADLPQTIADYRIIRKLGEGGMGIVYEAEQQDPHRSVALKVIRGGPYVDEYTLKLFQREIHTLALLKHSGIAAIYEAGHTETGQHFFAMELVGGVPLDEYILTLPVDASDPRRQIRQRLDLFLQICDAIAYAHQRGVIHRDLKPNNIMVVQGAEESGNSAAPTKVLDFGLARITSGEEDGATVLTRAGQVLGTLPYMSPEQARGIPEEIDLRTDIYALGAILYRLLTGKLPLELGRSATHEAVRRICEETPERPSLINRHLGGDLETIVLKALEKTTAERYQSVLALSGDITRYLTNQPILARPPSTAYQLKKLVQRHKGAVAFAGTMVVLLAAFAVTMSAMFGVQQRERRRADAERDRAMEQTERATSEAQKAAQINTFLQEMLSSVDPEKARGEEVTMRQVLDEASERMETGLAEQPEIQAAVGSTIGKTYMALALYDSAEPHLNHALATRRELFGEEHVEVASSLSDLAGLMWERGDYQAAEPYFRDALEIHCQLLGREHLSVASDMSNLALLLKDQGRYAEAESLCCEALAVRRKLLDASAPAIALSLNNLATLLQAQGRYAEAVPLMREALETRRVVLGEDHPEVAEGLNNLAALLVSRGEYGEAEPLLRDALALNRKLYGDDHPSVAITLSNLATSLDYQGRYMEAEQLYREALVLYKAILGEQHPAVAGILNNLATLLNTLENDEESEALHRETLSMRQALLGADHPSVATSMANLALVLHDRGALAEAELLYRRALEIRQGALGDDHPRVASTLLGLGAVLVDEQKAPEAEPLLRRCLEIRRGATDEDSWLVAHAKSTLGRCLACQGHYVEAESLVVASLPVIEKASALSLRRKQQAIEHAIALYEDWGKPQEAASYRNALGRLSTGDQPQ